MARPKLDLEGEAKELGYKDEADMLRKLYEYYSITALSLHFNKSYSWIRGRLVAAGVDLKGRGGANR